MPRMLVSHDIRCYHAASVATHGCLWLISATLDGRAAESSITFDDVTVVINSCRVNVASFDPVNNMPQLGPQVGSTALAQIQR